MKSFDCGEEITSPALVTHEVRDMDTGRLICTLPITSGGMEPTYRVYKIPAKANPE